MSLEQKLGEERRARLAAERLLDQKSRVLIEANRKLAVHARNLSEQIVETQQEAEELRDQNSEVLEQLETVSSAYAIAEQRLWESLESIQDGFAVFDDESRMVAANKAFLSPFDGLADVSLGCLYDDIVKIGIEEGIVDIEGHDPAEWQREMQARWRLDTIPPKTIRLWNGSYIRMIERHTPNGDTVVLNLDMTEMMRMWAAVEAVPDGFVLYDQDDRLVMCNQRYREIYEISAPVMVPGASFEEILRYGAENGQYADAVGRVDEWVAERLSKHNQLDHLVEQQLGDGRWLRILEKTMPDGSRVGLRVDITEQKEQQRALDEARLQAEGLNRAKSAFFANMSHELRTPMNGVVGMADLLCDTDLSDEQKLYAETIRNSGESLLGLLNDVLDFSKMEAGKLSLLSESFDLERSIHEIVMLLQATAKDKDLDLIVDYDMFLPTRFMGDRGRVRQVLTNLIGNAVKFTDKGHVLVRVVGLEDDTPNTLRLHVTVEDTGIGVAPEMQSHIFGEFNQVEDQQNRKYEGTGLGLAITRQLVELMGGEVWLESEPGRGACFGFSLVLPKDEAQPDAPSRIEGIDAPVVVIDDQSVNRMILERQLAQMGLNTVLFPSADDAMAAWDTMPKPAMVISDERMPGLRGSEMAEKLFEAGETVPFFLLSSVAGEIAGPGIDISRKKPLLRRDLHEALLALLEPPAAQPPEPQEPQQMRILTAEDNKTNRLVFSKLVGKLNVDLTFAENGALAVDAFRAQRPDLIFMDISMPEMDGKEATAAIRAIEKQTGADPVPIYALTAHALAGDAEEILSCGLDHYLTKPLKRDQIFEAIRTHCPEIGLPPFPGETPSEPARTIP